MINLLFAFKINKTYAPKRKSLSKSNEDKNKLIGAALILGRILTIGMILSFIIALEVTTFEEIPGAIIDTLKEGKLLEVIQLNSASLIPISIFLFAIYLFLWIYANIAVSALLIISLESLLTQEPLIFSILFIVINLLVLSFWSKRKLLRFLKSR